MRVAVCVVPLLLWELGGARSVLTQAAGTVSAAATPTFAVASIRPNLKPTHMRMEFTVDGFLGEGVTLHQLILVAYGIPETAANYGRLAGEPEWVDEDYFDVKAKIDDSFASSFAELSMDQRRQMLQLLLADRFALKVHSVTVERPIYELVIAPGGPKLTAAKPDELHPSSLKGGEDGLAVSHGRIGNVRAEGESMDAFAIFLGTQGVDRPVVNRTGLTALYSFSLRWAPGELSSRSSRAEDDAQTGPIAPDPPGGSTIFTEIQKQLGLKLQRTKGPVEILVVDQASMPTSN